MSSKHARQLREIVKLGGVKHPGHLHQMLDAADRLDQVPHDAVIDYEAWKNGYLPPSEHVLIDELAHDKAKVVMSSTGRDFGIWLVVKGGTVPRHARLPLMTMIHDTLECIEREARFDPSQTGPWFDPAHPMNL